MGKTAQRGMEQTELRLFVVGAPPEGGETVFLEQV